MHENVYSDITFPDFMQSCFGVSIQPKIDGRIHRFSTTGRRGDLDGWYIYYQNPSGRDVCIANSWRYASDKLIWLSGKGAITHTDREYMRKSTEDADRQRRAQENQAAIEAAKEYAALSPASDSHPYLVAKGVHAYEGVVVTQDGSTLIIPLYSPEGDIVSYERIFPDPDNEGKFVKRFRKYGRKLGCFFVIGNPGKGDEAWLCEGYATGASIYEATERPVVVAFDGGNMRNVANALKERLKLTVVADNDDKGKGTNPGKDYAERTGLPYKLIPEAGSDANDYAALYGLEALRDFLMPRVSEWIVGVDEFLSSRVPVEWHIRGWLEKNAMQSVFGASNSGKTFVVLDMLLTLTSGLGSWFGHKAKRASCLYLCGEGLAGLSGRIALWKQEHGIEDIGSFAIAREARYLNEPADLAYAVEQIELSDMRPDVIAIDTLNRFFSGNENHADEIGAFINSLKEIQRRYGSTIVIIHHTGVSEDAQNRMRGSTALNGSLEIGILVRNEDGCITLEQTKNRDAEKQPELHLRLKGAEIEGWFDEDGEPVRSAVVEGMDEGEKRALDATEELSILMRAWLRSEHGFALGYPSIAKDELRAYLANELGWSRDKVKKAFASDGDSRFLRKLFISGMVQAMDDLIVVTDSIWVSCCFLTLEGYEKEAGANGAKLVPKNIWHS